MAPPLQTLRQGITTREALRMHIVPSDRPQFRAPPLDECVLQRLSKLPAEGRNCRVTGQDLPSAA
jgi:hypothetical protein